jgi:hypothetical protein
MSIDRIADRLAIDELRYRYAYWVDTDQLEPLLELFTDDAVFDETPIGGERSEGAAALRALYARQLNRLKSHVHFVTNGITEFRGEDAAWGRCNFLWQAVYPDDGQGYATGYYDDLYARQDGRWRFHRRVVSPYGPPERPPFGAGG